jgi:hypothetical protein
LVKALTLKEIEAILAVTDTLGISREAVVIPLRTDHPDRLSVLKDGRLEIVVDRESEFADWLRTLEPRLRELMGRSSD